MTELCKIHSITRRFVQNNLIFTGRLLSTFSVVYGRKSRDPYDRRFGVSPRDVAPHKKGGTVELSKKLGKGGMMPQPPGYVDKSGKFVLVTEMIPDFVVPDLKDFKLKPYVSYRVSDVKQSEFTAEDLFNAVYAKSIVDDFQNGQLDVKKISDHIKEIDSKAKVTKN